MPSSAATCLLSSPPRDELAHLALARGQRRDPAFGRDSLGVPRATVQLGDERRARLLPASHGEEGGRRGAAAREEGRLERTGRHARRGRDVGQCDGLGRVRRNVLLGHAHAVLRRRPRRGREERCGGVRGVGQEAREERVAQHRDEEGRGIRPLNLAPERGGYIEDGGAGARLEIDGDVERDRAARLVACERPKVRLQRAALDGDGVPLIARPAANDGAPPRREQRASPAGCHGEAHSPVLPAGRAPGREPEDIAIAHQRDGDAPTAGPARGHDVDRAAGDDVERAAEGRAADGLDDRVRIDAAVGQPGLVHVGRVDQADRTRAGGRGDDDGAAVHAVSASCRRLGRRDI